MAPVACRFYEGGSDLVGAQAQYRIYFEDHSMVETNPAFIAQRTSER
jgi:hypothetical protein